MIYSCCPLKWPLIRGSEWGCVKNVNVAQRWRSEMKIRRKMFLGWIVFSLIVKPALCDSLSYYCFCLSPLCFAFFCTYNAMWGSETPLQRDRLSIVFIISAEIEMWNKKKAEFFLCWGDYMRRQTSDHICVMSESACDCGIKCYYYYNTLLKCY